MMPGRRPPISLVRNNQNEVSMNLTAGQYANTGIAMRAPYAAQGVANIVGGNADAVRSFGGIQGGSFAAA